MLNAEQLARIVRGTVVLVDLTDGVGKEQTKVRPAVVVSADTLNKRLTTLIVVPISGLKDKKPFKHEVFIRKGEGDLTEDSVAQPVQIRTLDRDRRVVRVLGQLSPATMSQLGGSLFGVLGGLP